MVGENEILIGWKEKGANSRVKKEEVEVLISLQGQSKTYIQIRR